MVLILIFILYFYGTYKCPIFQYSNLVNFDDFSALSRLHSDTTNFGSEWNPFRRIIFWSGGQVSARNVALVRWGHPGAHLSEPAWPPEVSVDIRTRASNEPSRRFKFYNHREGPYYGLLLVESDYQRFHIFRDCEFFVNLRSKLLISELCFLQWRDFTSAQTTVSI